MVQPSKLFGRLGNSMFQYAFLYAYAKDHGVDYYFQDPAWFAGYEEDIKHLFSTGIVKSDYVGIHVRRGDYVNNPFYVDLTKTDYYDRAMALFPGAKFKIFSDDPKWCSIKWGDREDVEISYGNELDDMNELAGCRGIIMANSSYSWWCAYLSNADIVAPKAWYTDRNETRTVLPSEWLRI